MTQAFATSSVIAAPPQQVWQVLTDWSRAPRWMSGASDVRLDGELRPGAVLHFTARGKPRSSTVSAVSPDRSLTLTSTQGPVTADYTYRLEPDGGTTRVHLVATVTITGPMRLLGGVIRSVIARADGGQLERLTEVVTVSGDAAR